MRVCVCVCVREREIVWKTLFFFFAAFFPFAFKAIAPAIRIVLCLTFFIFYFVVLY